MLSFVTVLIRYSCHRILTTILIPSLISSVKQLCYIICRTLHSVLQIMLNVCFFVLNAAWHLLTGGIVGIIIRYGVDAHTPLQTLDCWYNTSNKTELVPSSIVIRFNKMDYFKYTHGQKIPDNSTGQPQFEDKVVDYHFCSFIGRHICE